MSNTAQPTDHFVKVNDINLHYLDWGGDSPRNLLLTHGQNGTAHNWDFIAQELRDEFRVIALDQRGHGESDHTRDGYAVTAFATDLAEFAQAIGIVPFDLVGASLGGRNGISYAGDHSDQLKHFVTLDYGPEMSKDAAKKQVTGIGRRPLGWNSHDEFVEYSSKLDPRASLAYLRNQAQHGLRLNYAGKLVPMHDPDMFWINGGFGVREVPHLWEQWAKIRCPILELKGLHSDFLSPEIVERMREMQPSMQFLEVPDSGHPIPADNPDFLLRELRRFLVD
jgi:pimeloyl-ACP methyl ester carboxylesterase